VYTKARKNRRSHGAGNQGAVEKPNTVTLW
jgi:hypothetical protein